MSVPTELRSRRRRESPSLGRYRVVARPGGPWFGWPEPTPYYAEACLAFSASIASTAWGLRAATGTRNGEQLT